MRFRIREQFLDVRNNGLVGKALWNYIDSITGPNGLRVLENSGSSSSRAALSSGPKRKRKQLDEEDADYHPSPVRSLGQGAKTRARLRQNDS